MVVVNTGVIGYINIALEIFACLISLIIIICIMTSGNTQSRPNRTFLYLLVCNIIGHLSDALAWMLMGSTGKYVHFIQNATTFCTYIVSYIAIPLIVSYIISVISQREKITKTVMHISQVVCAIAIGLVIVSQFNHMYYYYDEYNVFHRNDMFWLSQAFGMFVIAVSSLLIIRHRKSLGFRNSVILLSYVILPLVAVVIQMLFYGPALLGVAMTLSLVTIYIGLQAEQARLLKEKETELAENRIAVMLSQIQPHFLYNSLAVIEQLCSIDPKMAEETVIEFSQYLRGNLDSLTIKKPIPFENEMKHVETYLSIEKKRFGDKLNIIYDIKTRDFLLPALSLQPIAENAVRYGITKKKNGGTLTIASSETKNTFVITVTDNGLGFDTSKIKQDGRSHVGITNTRSRLASMCGGTLEINSEQGSGTIVVITLPKGERQHEYNSRG